MVNSYVWLWFFFFKQKTAYEMRISDWSSDVCSSDLADVRALTDFFRARRGAARAFRFRDPFDGSSAADGGLPTATDQLLGQGDGVRRQFALVKRYGAGDAEQVRAIRLQVDGSVRDRTSTRLNSSH